MKFEEMEEKMRRQKQKGAKMPAESEENENVVKNDVDDDDNEAATEPTIKSQTVTYEEESSSETFNHHETYSTTTMIPITMETATLSMAEESTYTQIQRVPSPPRTVVESERIHLIEIKNGGSSGHLIRLPSGGYEQH